MENNERQQKIEAMAEDIGKTPYAPAIADQDYKLVRILDVFNEDGDIVLDGKCFSSELDAYDEVKNTFGEEHYALYFDHDLVWDADLHVGCLEAYYPELTQQTKGEYRVICGLFVAGNLTVTGHMRVDGACVFISGDAMVKSFLGWYAQYLVEVKGILAAEEFIWSGDDASTICGGTAKAPIFINETELYCSLDADEGNLLSFEIRDQDRAELAQQLQAYVLKDEDWIDWKKVIGAYRLGLPLYR